MYIGLHTSDTLHKKPAQALTGVPDNCDQGVPPRTTRFILNLMIVCSTMRNPDLFREIMPGTAFLFGLVYADTGHCGDQDRAVGRGLRASGRGKAKGRSL
jgi:hypothetical protein